MPKVTQIAMPGMADFNDQFMCHIRIQRSVWGQLHQRQLESPVDRIAAMQLLVFRLL